MRLLRAEFEILQQLRSIPEFTHRPQQLHLMLSGGKDSTALLQLLQRLQACPNSWSGVSFSLFAHHFNHKRRGADSDADEAHCADMARQLGVPLKIWRWTDDLDKSIDDGENFHALAREWRYKNVASCAEDLSGPEGSWWICTAHHRRDHAESVLHNITRGCGKSGLTGITPCSPEFKRLRPLLWLSVDLCDEYIARKKLHHRVDSSNEKLDYTRNRIRHIVIRELEALNPKAVEHIWNLSSDFPSEVDTLHTSESSETLPDSKYSEAVPLNQLESKDDLHRFIAQHAPEQVKRLTRDKLSNIFTHIKKCERTPKIPRRYIFALSDSFELILTEKHLQIAATRAVFSDSTTSLRGKL